MGPVCWSGPPRRPESAETGPKQRADTHTVSAGHAFALTCGAGPHPAPWAHCQSLSRSTGAAPGTAAKGCQPATCRPMVQPSTRPTEGHQLRRPARSFMLLTRVDGADSAGPRYKASRSTKQRPVGMCVCGTVRALVPCVFSPPPPVWCLSRPCVRELCG